jgi:hypothetical protein
MFDVRGWMDSYERGLRMAFEAAQGRWDAPTRHLVVQPAAA